MTPHVPALVLCLDRSPNNLSALKLSQNLSLTYLLEYYQHKIRESLCKPLRCQEALYLSHHVIRTVITKSAKCTYWRSNLEEIVMRMNYEEQSLQYVIVTNTIDILECVACVCHHWAHITTHIEHKE